MLSAGDQTQKILMPYCNLEWSSPTNPVSMFLANMVFVQKNMLLCRKWRQNEYGAFLHFEPLTLVPIDLDGVDLSLFNDKENQLLRDYQQLVYDNLAPHLEEDEVSWLKTLLL